MKGNSMFKTNKYSRWYFSIIQTARDRVTSGYVEKHHIIPKCLGGGDTKENIVRLYPKEHYICHLLLIRMTEGTAKSKMSFAVNMFARKNPQHQRIVLNSRQYSYVKKIFSAEMSILHKGKTVSPETIAKQKSTRKLNNKKRSVESKKKTSLASKIMWEENYERLVAALNTPECKEKQSISAKRRGRHPNQIIAMAKVYDSNKGAGNPRARKIEAVSPEGERFVIFGEFRKFCENKNLSFSSMCAKLGGKNFKKGSTVGWHVRYI
jgi:hypothetical protein